MRDPDLRPEPRVRRLPDPRLFSVMLDANVLQSGEGGETERLLELNREGELNCLLAPAVAAELLHPNTPVETRIRAMSVQRAPDEPAAAAEAYLTDQIAQVLRGEARAGRHRADAVNLAQAYRHGRFFVTLDRRVLARRQRLQQVMPSLWILSPAELLAAYDAARET